MRRRRRRCRRSGRRVGGRQGTRSSSRRVAHGQIRPNRSVARRDGGVAPVRVRAAAPRRLAEYAPVKPYPLGLMLAGRRLLVVGGGTVATRRVPALLDAGADVVVVSPRLSTALYALADEGRIHWQARRFEPSDVDGAWLVQVAVDD